MPSLHLLLLGVLLLGALIGNILMLRRYKEQTSAFQRCLSLADKLHTVGEIAASVTHEIRNPLTTIHGYLQIFSQKKEFMPYQGQITLLLTELDRANLLIKEYLSLCREHTATMKPTQLNDIISALLPLLQAQANNTGAEIILQLAALPEIALDDKEIRQLILNLVRNGLEAMDTGKTITIKTGVTADGETVLLSIADQGRGIPGHILAELGKPFVTTKENGTGLGLSVCYRIAARHQAAIKVDTGTSGTVFSLLFPLNVNASQQASAAIVS